jgi:hypothetical protein
MEIRAGVLFFHAVALFLNFSELILDLEKIDHEHTKLGGYPELQGRAWELIGDHDECARREGRHFKEMRTL